MGTVNKTVLNARLGLEFVFVFLGYVIYLYVHVCFVLTWSVVISLYVLALV